MKISRGKKQCCKCLLVQGVRTKQCICGHSFNVNSKTKEVKIKEQEPEVKPLSNFIGYLIYAPAGFPPFKLKSHDKEDVYAWCRKTFNHGLKNNLTYSANALQYWSVAYFDATKETKDIINEWDSEEGHSSNLPKNGSN